MIGLDNGLASNRRQAIIKTNVDTIPFILSAGFWFSISTEC